MSADAPKFVGAPVLEMQRHRAREHQALHIASHPLEVPRVLAVVHADHILVDDRPVVEHLRHVVRGGPDQLHPALTRTTVGVGAREGRKEGVMDVDDRHPHPLQEIAAEDLHVACQHEQLGIAAQELEHLRLGPSPAARLDRHVVEGHAGRDRLLLEVVMVGDHRHDLHVELAAAPAPQQLLQAMVMARDQDREAPALTPPADLPSHVESLGELRLEFLLEALTGGTTGRDELGA
jgi:hypothetical protein